jgi:hypothetical protein
MTLGDALGELDALIPLGPTFKAVDGLSVTRATEVTAQEDGRGVREFESRPIRAIVISVRTRGSHPSAARPSLAERGKSADPRDR